MKNFEAKSHWSKLYEGMEGYMAHGSESKSLFFFYYVPIVFVALIAFVIGKCISFSQSRLRCCQDNWNQKR